MWRHDAPVTARQLVPGDEAVVRAFLAPRADGAMFLLSNLRAVGLRDSGAPYEGTYVGAFRGGTLIGVAAHYWNGMLVIQAPEGMAALMAALRPLGKRRVAGLSGPHAQALAAHAALDLARDAAVPRLILMGLDLDALRIPPALAAGRIGSRRSAPSDLALAALWQATARAAALGRQVDGALIDEVRDEVARYQRDGGHWLAIDAGRPAAACAVIAYLPDRVQIGAVWTPPELRGRGFARAAVAGALRDLRAAGFLRAVLFVDAGNAPARAVYRALGFSDLEDFAAVLFPA